MADQHLCSGKKPLLVAASVNNQSGSTFSDLDDEVIRCILAFLPSQFRFVAAVDRRFRRLYPHGTDTLYDVAVASDKTVNIWFAEDEQFVYARGCIIAARLGKLQALIWLRSQTPPCCWKGACFQAICHGQLNVLQWLQSQDPPSPYNRSMACPAAARRGHIPVLQWLRAQTPPCPWGDSTFWQAAINGHLPTLKWLRAQSPPCPVDLRSSRHAAAIVARNGHLHVLQWLPTQDR